MQNSSALCLDASIVIRLILMPDDLALQELWKTWDTQNYRLFAPNLLYYEITNAFYQQEKNKILSANFIASALDFVLSLPIQLIGDSALHQRAHELAVQYHLPATYDAHYLALAERLNAELWTTDARLYNSVQSQGVGWVRLSGK